MEEFQINWCMEKKMMTSLIAKIKHLIVSMNDYQRMMKLKSYMRDEDRLSRNQVLSKIQG